MFLPPPLLMEWVFVLKKAPQLFRWHLSFLHPEREKKSGSHQATAGWPLAKGKQDELRPLRMKMIKVTKNLPIAVVFACV